MQSTHEVDHHLQTVESRQVYDAASCLFHTLLLHRTTGKFRYSTELNYKIGSIGLQEVQCEEIDLTYVSLGEGMDSFMLLGRV